MRATWPRSAPCSVRSREPALMAVQPAGCRVATTIIGDVCWRVRQPDVGLDGPYDLRPLIYATDSW